ncbi:MAG: ABC transporter permease [Proteobacteria bacterium]|jgi:peptide/nickel transport system permease protein|nr:ABC transporter permease [Pseudomonadota bacterium]
MATTNETLEHPDMEELFGRKSFFEKAVAMVRQQPVGAAGFFIIAALAFLAAFAGVISPYSPEVVKFEDMLLAPGAEYWFGTDQFGRDILTRLIYGSRTALTIGFVAAFSGATTGLILGVASAYFGGKIDLILQRFIDVFIAFPVIIMALAIVAVFGTNLGYVVLAIALPFVPDASRIVRSSALTLREIPFVDAARALGYSHSRIILRHMLPNVMAPYLIILTANIGQAILLEASLSYLGLGVQEPTPAWGLMLQGGAEEYAESAPWVPIFPGLAITLAVFGFNLFGDGLRDMLDPRLRSGK